MINLNTSGVLFPDCFGSDLTSFFWMNLEKKSIRKIRNQPKMKFGSKKIPTIWNLKMKILKRFQNIQIKRVSSYQKQKLLQINVIIPYLPKLKFLPQKNTCDQQSKTTLQLSLLQQNLLATTPRPTTHFQFSFS